MKMSRKDYLDWTNFKNQVSNQIIENEITLIARLHAIYFKHSYYKPCFCSPKTYNRWIGDLNKLHKKGYENK